MDLWSILDRIQTKGIFILLLIIFLMFPNSQSHNILSLHIREEFGIVTKKRKKSVQKIIFPIQFWCIPVNAIDS